MRFILQDENSAPDIHFKYSHLRDIIKSKYKTCFKTYSFISQINENVRIMRERKK